MEKKSNHHLRVRFILIAFLLLAVLLMVGGRANAGAAHDATTPGIAGGQAALDTPAAAKYVIVLIGDGMGPQQVQAANYFNGGPLTFETLPYQATVTTASADSSVTDSAAAATAMATGQKVNNGVISMAIPGDNSELETVLELYKAQGKNVGMVSTAYMTHATPAGFGAHEPSRNNLSQIAADYFTQTQPHVLLGGGANGMTSAAATGAGYTVVNDRAAMQALNTETAGLVSGQFGSSHLPYEYDGDYTTLPHLNEMTDTALAILDNNTTSGFFLMVEAGRIDHAGHDNQLERNVQESLEFSDTVQKVIDWVNDPGNDSSWANTLVLVTADHETGGMTITQDNGPGNYPTVTWSTTGHTGVNVPIYANGLGADLLTGDPIDNTDVYALLTGTMTPPPPGVLDIRVGASDDDAEERVSTGAVDLTSTDIELGDDPGHSEDQTVGLRFQNVGIPEGASITAAYLEFETDELDSIATSVTIWGQAADNAPVFTSATNNITNRTTTTSSAAWNNIPAWNTTDEKHQSPSLVEVVQEVVNRPGWTPGNSLALIISGTGSRTAESFDGEPAAAALLHIEYALMQNPGFESDFTGWTDWGNSSITTAEAHSGAKAARIGTAAGGRAQRIEALVPGSEYTLCAWSKLSSLSEEAWVGVDIYDSSDTKLANHQWQVGWTSYQRQSVTFTVPANTDYTNVYVWKVAGSGYAYVDDFILVEGATCGDTPEVPADPGGLTASPAGAYQINIAWTDNAYNEDGYKVERSPNGADSWSEIASLGANVANYADSGLAANSTHYYRVYAHNAEGNSGYSNVDSATTSDPPQVSIEVMSWVPPYAIAASQAAVQADFGACDAIDGLTRVGLQFWLPNTDGTIKYHPTFNPEDADVAWWTNWGQTNGIEILLTIYNNDGSWNWDLARSAFDTNRATFVSSLVAEMERLNLDGIDLDLEGVGTLDSDRAAFDQFVHDLWVELDARGKILTIDSFHYIWNAPNHNWWSDWVGEVDNIHSMGYDDLFEGGTTWHKYSYQQNAGYTAGYDGDDVLMGMPGWLASWGASSGRGVTAQAHVQEVRYDLPEPTGIAIWDLQLTQWQDSALWCEIEALKDLGSSNNTPTASFTYLVNDLDVDFTDASTDSDGTVDSWSWDFGDGNSSTAQNPTHNYASAGTYSVNLEVTDNDGATHDVSQSVTVTEPPNVPPTADFTYLANDLDVDFTDASTDSDGTVDSWSWDFGDGNSSTAQNPTHSYASAGTFSVNLEVTDNDGATHDVTQSVTVTEPLAYVDYTATGETFVAGTVLGSYANTHTNDDVYQSIQERESGGKPTNRHTWLEHQWTFNIPGGGTTTTLYAQAWAAASTDGDTFTFAYSTNGSTFVDMFPVAAETDDDSYQTYDLSGLSGTITIRVIDTDRTQSHRSKDTVNVDHLYIRTENTPVVPPAAPTGLSATAISGGQINLSWTDNSENELGFYIERSPDGLSGWVRVGSAGMDSETFSDMGLNPNTTYFYQVQAHNYADVSGYTNIANDTTFTSSNMQVEALEPSSEPVRNKWKATVGILVTESDGLTPVADATVTGNWSAGATGSALCTTDASGYCSVSKNNLKGNVASVTFTVVTVTHASYTLDLSNSVTEVIVPQ